MRLISAAALLLLAACSQGTEQPSNEVGNSHNQNQPLRHQSLHLLDRKSVV